MSSKKRKGVALEDTKVAVYWRTSLYLLSASVFAVTLLDFSRQDWYECIGNLGLTLIFGGMTFRSREAAVLAYCSDIDERERLTEKVRNQERKIRPWVGWMMKSGWALMLGALFVQLTM